MEAASQFGEIVDIPFPNVDPTFSSEKVQDIAENIEEGTEDMEELVNSYFYFNNFE